MFGRAQMNLRGVCGGWAGGCFCFGYIFKPAKMAKLSHWRKLEDIDYKCLELKLEAIVHRATSG